MAVPETISEDKVKSTQLVERHSLPPLVDGGVFTVCPLVLLPVTFCPG
jgi:hypothetical protein